MRTTLRYTATCCALVGSVVIGTGCDSARAQQQTGAQEVAWWQSAGRMPTFQASHASWDISQEPFFPPEHAYPRYAVPRGAEQYARLDAGRVKQHMRALTAISRKSRTDGNQYWGRITGTKYDHEATEWVETQFRRIGLQDVRFQEWNLPTQWYANSWQVTLTGSGQTVNLTTAYPWWGSASANNVVLEPVWAGLGTAADFAGRDVRGKAVIIHSIPSPGGLNNSAGWSGAVQRARENGAAAVFMVLGIPGNVTSHPTGMSPPPWSGLTFSLGMADGTTIRNMIENGQSPRIRIQLDVATRNDMTTKSVWGVLPGASDENILIMAHTESFFEGALDNASGVGMMLELAEYYAAIPQAQRPRTITFLTTSAHHAPGPEAGIHWVRDNMHDFFARTALIVNCEHAAQTQTYFVGPNLVASNAVAARRFYVQGPDELKGIIANAFNMFGVTHYSRPATGSGGELGAVSRLAPGFHVLADIFYHTDLDIEALVPEAGIESTLRAYAKVIDDVNRIDLAVMRSAFPMTQ